MMHDWCLLLAAAIVLMYVLSLVSVKNVLCQDSVDYNVYVFQFSGVYRLTCK